jgi:hypothetical protein
MDIVEMIEQLYRIFIEVKTYDLDPDIPVPTLMDEGDSYCFMKTTQRAVKWLIEKVFEANLDPIIVTIDKPGDSLEDLKESLGDKRSA